MLKYTADFETASWSLEETYVWAWALCDIENSNNIKIGNSIESFFEEIEKENCILYFHNLKFDSEFIFYYLLHNDYKLIKDSKEKADKTFTCLINDMGIIYSMEIYFKVRNKKVKKVTIYDSYKIIPIAVEEIPESFGFTMSKLNLDYKRFREKGYILKPYEERYIKADVKIVADALKMMFDMELTSMTIASNALKNFKEKIGKKYERLFPEIKYELYKDLKQAYRGGFTYLNKIYKDKDNGETINLDVNSLYPSVMRYKPLPYGEPIFFEGKYIEDKVYPLYIQRITCAFELKKNKIPTIQLKGSMYYQENEYLESSKNRIVALTLTNIDLKLFLENYDTFYLEYECGWKFKSLNGIFNDYIDYWIDIKNKATIEKNKGKRTIAKLLLNSLYGRFAKKMKVRNKYPFLNEKDVVCYELGEEEIVEGLYIPIASFITSYAREITIRTSQAIKEYSLEKYGVDMYIYSDTDSIKTLLPLEELKQFCEIDQVELGKWKYEGTARRSKFIRQKTYLEEMYNEKEGEWEIITTCAGLPKTCYQYIEWDTFKEGFSCGGKLDMKHIKGGIILVETEFTIKGELFDSMKKFDKMH